jgi:hypothetical protein
MAVRDQIHPSMRAGANPIRMLRLRERQPFCRGRHTFPIGFLANSCEFRRCSPDVRLPPIIYRPSTQRCCDPGHRSKMRFAHRIGTQERLSRSLIQARICAQQIVEASIFGGKVLEPFMVRSVGVRFESRQLDKRQPMVALSLLT